jgi:hypothetical protein
MANPTQIEQRTATDSRPGTAPLGRNAIEQALHNALETGPNAIGQQVRYILALSQMAGEQPVSRPYPEKSFNVALARMTALTHIAESLTEAQVRALVKEARQIGDVALRIQLLTRLAVRIPPQNYRSLVRDLWNNARNLPDPVVRARTLFQLAPLLTLDHDEPAASAALLEAIAIAQNITSTEARIRSLMALAPHLPPTMCARLLQRVLDDVDALNNDNLKANAISALVDPLPQEIQLRALETADSIHTPTERARALTALARHLPQELQPRLRAKTLDAISSILSEEERAEALIAFSPNLEYAGDKSEFPALLARALAIAIAMTRRHIRAKVLVALAPHLTLDLQGEALAAVHSLSNERDRAMLLAELAPNLPPEMLVASLAIAHTMREQDSRVHALTILAHHVPQTQNARGQTMLDALAAASNLPHHFERINALIDLLDILPDQLREQAYTNALETTRLIENENARARALSRLGQFLPQNLLGRALDAAYKLKDFQQRLNALNGIVPYLGDEQRREALHHMLESARQMPLDYKRARALVSIAPLLTPELVEEALVIVDGLEDPYDRVNAYIALAQKLPPDHRPTIVLKAWQLIKEIEDGYDRASALAAIAPFLPPAARKDIAQAAGMVIGSIMDEYDQASAITILASLLADTESVPISTLPDYYLAIKEGIDAALNTPQQALRVQLLNEGAILWREIVDSEQRYRLWYETSLRLTRLPLADTLLCLGVLMPVIRTMAGDEGVYDIARILGVR